MDATVRDVLTRKSRGWSRAESVYTARRDDTVASAARRMNEQRIGSLLVLDEGRPIGIFSERDVLTRVVEPGRDPETTRVADVMTPNPVTIGPSCTLREAMQLMTAKRVRHLPVVIRDAVVGLVSIGDLVWWLTEALESENQALHTYIHGPAVTPH